MEEKRRKANWNDYPIIEECSDMGDTNGNKMDVEIEGIEDRAVQLREENKEK